MKKIFLMLNMVFLSLSIIGCANHQHIFTYNYDFSSHYYQCVCGEVKERKEHSYIWIVDKEATTIEDGLRHQECTTCNCKINENTVINKIELEVIRHEIPTPLNSINFSSHSEMCDFLSNYQSDLLWLYLDEINDDSINIFNTTYRFDFDEKTEEKYSNSSISIMFSLYSEILGTDTEENEYVPYHSITFLFNMIGIDESCMGNISYDFHIYENNKTFYNNVIYVYSEKLIGKIYYYTTLDIEKNWIESFLNENLKVLK